jgi:hypothetical protein
MKFNRFVYRCLSRLAPDLNVRTTKTSRGAASGHRSGHSIEVDRKLIARSCKATSGERSQMSNGDTASPSAEASPRKICPPTIQASSLIFSRIRTTHSSFPSANSTKFDAIDEHPRSGAAQSAARFDQ